LAGVSVYAWKQNDKLKNGKLAADAWLKDVADHADAKVLWAKTPMQFVDLNDWTRAGATANDLLAAMMNAEVIHEAEKPLIEFRSPLQLKNFTPPPGIVFVGDCHIVKGSVFVIGGAPGIGKSRGAIALAVAGATGQEWFGLTVHRKFKTMIVQTENGEFRLARDFGELDCAALEDYVRVCPPPPYGLCFRRDDFRSQLEAAVTDFAPDVVVYDPWNAAAREQDSREYLNTFDALRSVLPLGDSAPALGIVAHTRKPKNDEHEWSCLAQFASRFVRARKRSAHGIRDASCKRRHHGQPRCLDVLQKQRWRAWRAFSLGTAQRVVRTSPRLRLGYIRQSTLGRPRDNHCRPCGRDF
jgi:hypothetical protein